MSQHIFLSNKNKTGKSTRKPKGGPLILFSFLCGFLLIVWIPNYNFTLLKHFESLPKSSVFSIAVNGANDGNVTEYSNTNVNSFFSVSWNPWFQQKQKQEEVSTASSKGGFDDPQEDADDDDANYIKHDEKYNENMDAKSGNVQSDYHGNKDDEDTDQQGHIVDHGTKIPNSSSSSPPPPRDAEKRNDSQGHRDAEKNTSHRNNIVKNQIQLENELLGSPEWVLSKPAIGREVEGYMSRTSVNKGERISLFYNVNPTQSTRQIDNMTHPNMNQPEVPANVTIEVFRTGWYQGIGARKVYGPIQVPGIFQIMPESQRDGLTVCAWRDPHVIETNSSWTTGVYLVKMTETVTFAQSYAIFVLRDDRLDSRNDTSTDILFQLPVNTYQAYNRWGGRSLYGCYSEWGGHNMQESGQRCHGARKVSFDRPYAQPWNSAGSFGLGAGEYLSNVQPIASYPIKSTASWNYNMVRWLERNNLSVSYITNLDVHTRLHKLSKPKVFLTQGHDEYWTWTMRDYVTSWRDQGVHLAFLGSNTAFWQIRYEDISNNGTESEEPRTVVCFRWPKQDPDKSQYRSIKWRDIRPEALMVGVEYIFPVGDPFDEDIIVSNHSHWLFHGTGVKRGDKIPGILGYEVDRIANTKPRRGNTEPEIPLASIAKIFETPLVNRLNQSITAHSSLYEAKSGSIVFGAGTMQWSWGLDDYGVQQGLRSSRLSSIIEKMTWNYLERCGIQKSSPTTASSIADNVIDDEKRNQVLEEKHKEEEHESKSRIPSSSTSNSTSNQSQNLSWATNITHAHMNGWIYEPNNLDHFWKRMGDRPFQAEFYSKLGKYNRILDVGVRGYNRQCKAMINSSTTEYFQMEPFPPKSEEMNNDGLLNCFMQEAQLKYPNFKSYFDVVIDFGVFGWKNVIDGFGVSGIQDYIESVVFLLKDNGCWALKTDKGWTASYNATPVEFFDKYILPHFKLGDEFNGYKSGHNLRRGNFVFYFFYKK